MRVNPRRRENFRVKIALVVLERCLMCHVLEDELFNLGVIRNIAIVVEPASLVPGASHQPAPASNQNQFKAVLGALVVNVALNECHEPVRRDMLRFEVLAHVVVPHVPVVHRSLITNKRVRNELSMHAFRQSHGALLRCQCQLEVVAEVEAMAHVLFDLLFYRRDRFDCLVGQRPVEGDQFDFLQLEDDGGVLIGADGQRLQRLTHFGALHDDNKVEALLDVKDADEAENFALCDQSQLIWTRQSCASKSKKWLNFNSLFDSKLISLLL